MKKRLIFSGFNMLFFLLAFLTGYAMELPEPKKMKSEKVPIKGAKQIPEGTSGPSSKKVRICEKSIFDALPPEIQTQILKYVTGQTLDEAIKGIKRFYVAVPASRDDILINQIILEYLMQSRFIFRGSDLQYVVNNLNTFPVFKDPEMLQWIEEQKTRLNDEQELGKAAGEGNDAKIQELINKKVNINVALDYTNITALMFAIINNKESAALILINNGAHVNARDLEGKTSLHFAMTAQNNNIIKELLKKGAEPNIKASSKAEFLYSSKTPLLVLVSFGFNSPAQFLNQKAIFEELLKAGGNPDEKDGQGQTAKDYLRRKFNLTDRQKTELFDLIKQHEKKP